MFRRLNYFGKRFSFVVGANAITALWLVAGVGAQEMLTGTCYRIDGAPSHAVAVNEKGDIVVNDGRTLQFQFADQSQTVELYSTPQGTYHDRIRVAGLSRDGRVAFNVQNSSTGTSEAFVVSSTGQINRINVPGAISVVLQFMSADGKIVGGSTQTEPSTQTSQAFMALDHRGNTRRILRPPQTGGSISSAVSMNRANVVVDGPFPAIYAMTRNLMIPIVPPLSNPGSYMHFIPILISEDGKFVAGLTVSSGEGPSGSIQQVGLYQQNRSGTQYDFGRSLPGFSESPYSMSSSLAAFVGNNIYGAFGQEALVYEIGEEFSTRLVDHLCQPSGRVQLNEVVAVSSSGAKLLVRGQIPDTQGPVDGGLQQAMFVLSKTEGLSSLAE